MEMKAFLKRFDHKHIGKREVESLLTSIKNKSVFLNMIPLFVAVHIVGIDVITILIIVVSLKGEDVK